MAGLEQLKKRLHSVKLTQQLTNAMKTTASAKYTVINKQYSDLKKYLMEVEEISSSYNISDKFTTADSTKPDCIVIIGYTRGFCGAYNNELHSFASKILQSETNYKLFIVGKSAISYFSNKFPGNFEEVLLPETINMQACKDFINLFYSLYQTEKVKSVKIIYQSYVNTMLQQPIITTLLPNKTNNNEENADFLFFPNKKTVFLELHKKLFETKLYKIFIEAALGAQASSLIAMKTAVDHANETIKKIETEIQKKRQSTVTTGVIEISSSVALEEEN